MMVGVFRPPRGGFLRPFGCAQFIVSFLKGESPHGSLRVDPARGACQEDIFAEYKEALHRSFAEDMVGVEEEKRARRGLPAYTAEEADRRLDYWMARIPMKFTRMRYHSFLVYFAMLKRLGWVEPTGEIEPSTAQEPKPGVTNPRGQPRIYYRLTSAGRRAPFTAIMNPLRVLYPDFTASYFREKRKTKRYTRARPR